MNTGYLLARYACSRIKREAGRVVLLEYRGGNPLILIKAFHKMTQKQVRKEMQVSRSAMLETKSFLPQQHLMVFGKLDLSTATVIKKAEGSYAEGSYVSP